MFTYLFTLVSRCYANIYTSVTHAHCITPPHPYSDMDGRSHCNGHGYIRIHPWTGVADVPGPCRVFHMSGVRLVKHVYIYILIIIIINIY